MFANNSFEKRVKELANRSGLKLAEVSASRAKLLFTIGGHTQPLWILPYGTVWEFSCPSIVAVENTAELPQPLLVSVLQINATNKRGFWCLEKLGGKEVLEYMHNVPESLLTPDEFERICRSTVSEVEAFEQACLSLVRQLA
ncbi:MAG: hypothetical protein DCC57_16150 [Chloroflexi bacterium]|nr:MAG: hypothetical protein DCC57_16150 [Chloroflexota bacterium]